MHLINAHQRKRNTDSISSTRVAHCLNFVVKSVKHSYFVFLREFLTRFLLHCISTFSHLSLNVPLVKHFAEF